MWRLLTPLLLRRWSTILPLRRRCAILVRWRCTVLPGWRLAPLLLRWRCTVLALGRVLLILHWGVSVALGRTLLMLWLLAVGL